MHARLLVTWLFCSLAVAAAVRAPQGPPPASLLAATILWGALCAAGTRTALLLGAARKGAAAVVEDAPPHRLWRGGLVALLAGAALGALAGGGATLLDGPSTWPGWSIVLVATSLLAYPAGAALAVVALRRPRSRRRSTLLSWILVDTALPAGVLAAAAGVVIAQLRFGHLDEVSGVEASRHVAVSLLLYGVLLGVAGGLKTAREKLAGLVDAPAPASDPPGAIATGALLGLLVLLVGPRVIDTVEPSALVAAKAALGIVAGTTLCALGALRGARR